MFRGGSDSVELEEDDFITDSLPFIPFVLALSPRSRPRMWRAIPFWVGSHRELDNRVLPT